MNSRLKFLLPAALAAAAALAGSACGGRQELQAALPQATPSLLLPNATAPEAAAQTPVRRAFTPVIEPAFGEALELGLIREADGRLGREIEFSFPLLTGETGRRVRLFNRAVRALAEGVVGDFKRSHPGAGARWDGLKESLRGSYQTTHFTEELIGLRFFAYSRSPDGRRLDFFRVLNFDLVSGKTLALGDLFRPEAEYLDALAAYCIADLKRQAAEAHRREVARTTQRGRPAGRAGAPADALIESGAAAEADNYRAWNLTAEGILVSFAACQVDSCAAGDKEVLVPYSALGAILSSDGPAARLVTRPSR